MNLADRTREILRAGRWAAVCAVLLGVQLALWLARPDPAGSQQETTPGPYQAQPAPKPVFGQTRARPNPFSFLTRGRELLRSGNAGEAALAFRHYTRIKPDDPSGHFWLGLSLDESRQPSQAIWAYSRSLDLAMREGMDSPELRVNIGNTLMKLNRLDDAIFNYRRALAIDAKLTRAHYNLGRALLRKGEPQAAFESLNRCTELGLNDPTILYYEGQALKAMGKPEDARQKLELFVRQLPATPQAQAMRTRVEDLIQQLPSQPGTNN
ncbi:MAG TPA: tetratricopeptide repeat protein [Candidatus Obscuribacterales bacterium]